MSHRLSLSQTVGQSDETIIFLSSGTEKRMQESFHCFLMLVNKLVALTMF